MTCPQLEQTSALLDNELSASEATRARGHIATCADCGAFERDALQLRTALRALPPQPTTNNQQLPLWRRRIAIPIPAFAAMLVVVIATILFTRPPRRDVAPSFRDFDAGRAPVVLVRPRSWR